MIILSSDSIELILYFRSFSFMEFSSCPHREIENDVYNAKLYIFEVCFEKDMGGFGSSRSKNFTKNRVGELKVCKIGTPESSIR